jgi:hypothetical protein
MTLTHNTFMFHIQEAWNLGDKNLDVPALDDGASYIGDQKRL